MDSIVLDQTMVVPEILKKYSFVRWKKKNKIETNCYLLVDPVLGTGVGDAEWGSRSNSGIRQTWA